MTTPKPAPSLADRKRQLVVDELTEAALQLLAIKGFHTTTVDEIVAAAGVSRRTFFRYFASKEDVVVQLLAGVCDIVLAELVSRPADEPIVTALRHALAIAVDDCAGHPGDPARATDPRKALRVVQMVLNTPALLARYLERQSRAQAEMAAVIAVRHPSRDALYPTLAAGTAITVLHAVLLRWSDSDGAEDPVDLLDRAFAQVAPALQAKSFERAV